MEGKSLSRTIFREDWEGKASKNRTYRRLAGGEAFQIPYLENTWRREAFQIKQCDKPHKAILFHYKVFIIHHSQYKGAH